MRFSHTTGINTWNTILFLCRVIYLIISQNLAFVKVTTPELTIFFQYAILIWTNTEKNINKLSV